MFSLPVVRNTFLPWGHESQKERGFVSLRHEFGGDPTSPTCESGECQGTSLRHHPTLELAPGEVGDAPVKDPLQVLGSKFIFIGQQDPGLLKGLHYILWPQLCHFLLLFIIVISCGNERFTLMTCWTVKSYHSIHLCLSFYNCLPIASCKYRIVILNPIGSTCIL